jgi:hypothetical protein
MELKCPKCQNLVSANDSFCPHCGNKLKEVDKPLGFFDYMKIFTVTIFLAPFGLYWFIKLIKSPDKTKKIVAVLVLLITLVLIVLTIGMMDQFLTTYKSYLDSAYGY